MRITFERLFEEILSYILKSLFEEKKRGFLNNTFERLSGIFYEELSEL